MQDHNPIEVGNKFSLRGLQRWWEESHQRSFDIRRLTRRDVRHWIEYRQQVDGARPATINRCLSSLRTSSRWAISEGLLVENPTTGIEEVASVQMAPAGLSPIAIDELLRSATLTGQAHPTGSLRISQPRRPTRNDAPALLTWRPVKAGSTWQSCLNRNYIPNYGDRCWYGEIISTAFVGSAVNELISRRMVKKQQMRWTKKGAHLLL